ncbi:hypothetical protein [Sphingobacterium sp. NPDC055346]
MNTLLNVIYYISAAIVAYQILRACLHWFLWFTRFMFDEGFSQFESKLEKPRMFFHIITIGLSLVAFMQLKDAFLSPFISSFYFSAILFFGIVFYLTWRNIFETRFIPAVKKKLSRINSDFKSNYTHEESAIIFRSLVSNGYLIYDDITIQKEMEIQFIYILLNGILPQKSLFFCRWTIFK